MITMKELQKQINELKKEVKILQRIWEIQYLVKSKIEAEIYENIENKIHINATNIKNGETIVNATTKEN